MNKEEENKIKALAEMVHEANRAFCKNIGDNSQQPWNEAPGYNHESTMVTVWALFENPTLTPSDLHDIWVDSKRADGWKYGPKKDRDLKTHPSMVPYKDLSVAEKYKDHLVYDIVMGYLNFRKGATT